MSSDVPEPSFLTSSWNSFESYLPNVFRFKRDKKPKGDYTKFVNDLSAVGRILNGLELNRKLRKGSLDMVQVVAEMAGVGLDRPLIDELEQTKWAESEKTMGNVTDQMNTFSAATWDDKKITDGLTALEGLVAKVKPIAGKLDLAKINDTLSVFSDIKSVDYTLLDGNPVEKVIKAIDHLNKVTIPIPSSEEGNVMTSVTNAREGADRVEKVVAMIATAQTSLGALVRQYSSGNAELMELVKCIDLIKKSAANSQILKDLVTELTSFLGTSDKIVPLREVMETLNPSLPLLEKFVNAFISGHQMKLNLTLGLPQGPADLDAISSDLKLSRNQKLISGGGKLTVLNDDLKLITAKKEDIKKSVTGWKAYHSDKKAQLKYLQDMESLAAVTSGYSSPPLVTSLVAVSSKLQPILDASSSQTSADFNTAITKAINLLKTCNGVVWSFNSVQQSFAMLKDLSEFKKVLRAGRSAPDVLADFKNFKGIADVKQHLETLSSSFQVYVGPSQFANLKKEIEAIETKVTDLMNLNTWIVDVKDFETPKDLDKSLSSTRDIVTNIRKVDPKSMKSIGTVITEAKAVTKSVTDLKTSTPAVKPKADDSKVSIDTWQQLDSNANTIGHAVRSAQALSVTDGIVAKLEQLKKSAKELDEAVQKAKDPNAKAEVQSVWSGYGSIESEVTKMKAEVKKVHDSVPGKTETLTEMGPVLEKMQLVNLQFSQIQQTATSFDTLSPTDPDLKQKTSAMQKSLEESLMPILSFQSSKAELKLAPDALELVSSFFDDFFRVGNPALVVGSSTTPVAASGWLWWHYLLLGSGILVVVGGTTTVVSWYFCCRKKRPPPPPAHHQKPPQPAKKDVVIDMDPSNTSAATTPANGTTSGANSTTSGSIENVSRPSREGSAEPENNGSLEQVASARRASRSRSPVRVNQRALIQRQRSQSPATALEAVEVDAVAPNNDVTTTEDTDTRTAEIPKLSSEANCSMSNVQAPIVVLQPPPNKKKTTLADMLASYEPMPRVAGKDSFPFTKHVNNDRRQPDYNAPWTPDSFSMGPTSFVRIPYRREFSELYIQHFPRELSRLIEEAKLGTEQRAPRDIRRKLFPKGLGSEPYSFLEFKTAKSGAELIAQKPKASQFAVFLEKAFQWGVVSIAAVVQEHLMIAKGTDRWWPSAVSETVIHGKISVKLISEEYTAERDIYTAKLQIWKTDVPKEVSTVHMNILISEFTADRLISVPTLARFQQRIQQAQYAAGGVLLRYGDSHETLTILMGIQQCMHQIMHYGQEHKYIIHDMQNKMPRGLITKEQYVLVCLVVFRLLLTVLGLQMLPEHLEMERQFEVLRGAGLPPADPVAAAPVAPVVPVVPVAPVAPALPVDPTLESEAS